ncbi:MAG TPA: abortive infection family protein [Candidatus Pacearchaeota archaeon]|nr:abortive infection family protein [Candidatus Pacearchaeota archaeon]
MKLLAEFILNNLTNYPGWAEYNDVVLDFISSYKQKRPDMCVEGCKSLIEGIAKFLYLNLDIDNQNLVKWKDWTLSQKFKKAIEMLNIDDYEKEFLMRNNSLVQKLGEIRNERGDISHGQSYPKNTYSDEDFAKFIASWTEGLCYFLLSSYVYLKRKQQDDELSYTKEQFKEFDNYLDSLNPDIKYISYSKALREQDPLQYELLMDGFITNKENFSN